MAGLPNFSPTLTLALSQQLRTTSRRLLRALPSIIAKSDANFLAGLPSSSTMTMKPL